MLKRAGVIYLPMDVPSSSTQMIYNSNLPVNSVNEIVYKLKSNPSKYIST